MINNLKIFFAFFIAAIAGVILHECGHIIAAWLGGCKSFHLGYSYMYAYNCGHQYYPPLTVLGEEYNRTLISKAVWQVAGGPLQTNLTGLLGIALLFRLSRRRVVDAWKSLDLFYIILCFFLSRNVFNTLTGLLKVKVSAREGGMEDEARLFLYYGIDETLGHIIMLLVASALLGYVTFVLVKKHRWQLILYGGAGSVVGGVLWLRWLGSILLP